MYEWDWPETMEQVFAEHVRDDGSRWTGASIERASGGYVPRRYVYDILKGRISQPSFNKIYAISRSTGIPLEEFVGRAEKP